MFSVSQRLTVLRRPAAASEPSGPVGTNHSLEALLEIDGRSMRLVAFALGQRVLSLCWDGKHLSQQRHPMLPDAVDGRYVLRDVQWAYGPADALRKQLPNGWQLLEQDGQRSVVQQGQTHLLIRYSGEPHWQARTELDNRLEGYHLIIETESTLEPAP